MMGIAMSGNGDWKRKLDHRLKAAMDRASGDPAGTSPAVSVFMQFRGDVRALQALGCTVRSVAGDVAVVNIHLTDVPRAAASPSVSFIELSGPAHLDG